MAAKKTFIVGDVHGCFTEFNGLLKKAGWNPNTHRLILLGDIINRGPDSLKMLEWARKNKAELICGNHEMGFLKKIKSGEALKPLLEKLKKDMGAKLCGWLSWLEKLPFYIEEEDFLAVHGGLQPHKHPKDTEPRILANIRTWDGTGLDLKNPLNPPWHSYYKGRKLVIYGHWAEQGLNIRKNTIGLDSGCVYGGALSGLMLPERKIIQTPSLKNYFSKAPAESSNS